MAIVNPDATPAKLPIALCELQGYVVSAKRAWADTLDKAFDDPAAARRLRDQADRLAEAIERRFWWAQEGTYYLGLDGDEQPIASIASNPGHLLWTGAVTDERAESVENRLMRGRHVERMGSPDVVGRPPGWRAGWTIRAGVVCRPPTRAG